MSSWETAIRGLNAAVVDTFGHEVLYLPSAGGQASIRGVLEATRETEDTAPGVYAILFVRLADLPVPPQRGDQVEISGATYKVFKVFGIEADEQGGVTLALRVD
ncbi:MAG: hypothetical protein IT165_06145 [Bryobacterales bacterium]|nr:hypothetical protein [Bryobacterales bacterium]